MRKIKITCTANERDELVGLIADLAPFHTFCSKHTNEECNKQESCFNCIINEVEWSIVEEESDANS